MCARVCGGALRRGAEEGRGEGANQAEAEAEAEAASEAEASASRAEERDASESQPLQRLQQEPHTRGPCYWASGRQPTQRAKLSLFKKMTCTTDQGQKLIPHKTFSDQSFV